MKRILIALLIFALLAVFALSFQPAETGGGELATPTGTPWLIATRPAATPSWTALIDRSYLPLVFNGPD